VVVLRRIKQPTHDALMDEQIRTATDKSGPGDLGKALLAGETWTVT